MSKKIKVLKTHCYPCSFTLTKNGITSISNGNWSIWFRTKEEAQTAADELNEKIMKRITRSNI